MTFIDIKGISHHRLLLGPMYKGHGMKFYESYEMQNAHAKWAE